MTKPALTPASRQVHQWVLTAFADTGRAPLRADLDRTARDRGVDPGPVLTELTGRDVIAVDERGEIRAAYPFSPIPTRHRVTWDGGGVHAMCAIDALGMSAMLGVPVTVTSTEPGTDYTVTVHVDKDTARWHPNTAVVFAGHINFFTSPDAAHDWATRNPDVTGVVLDQDQALANGVTEFGDLMRPSPTKEDT